MAPIFARSGGTVWHCWHCVPAVGRWCCQRLYCTFGRFRFRFLILILILSAWTAWLCSTAAGPAGPLPEHQGRAVHVPRRQDRSGGGHHVTVRHSPVVGALILAMVADSGARTSPPPPPPPTFSLSGLVCSRCHSFILRRSLWLVKYKRWPLPRDGLKTSPPLSPTIGLRRTASSPTTCSTCSACGTSLSAARATCARGSSVRPAYQRNRVSVFAARPLKRHR